MGYVTASTYGLLLSLPLPAKLHPIPHLPHFCMQVVGLAEHVLGYVTIGATGLLLLAEKVRSATLPGHHSVKTVTLSRWHRIPLQV